MSKVDMNTALSSASYAQAAIRSGELSVSERGQIVARWGAENVNRWLSADSTDYQITDEDYSAAKESGIEYAKSKTNHDGKADSTASAVVSGIGGAAVGVAGVALTAGAGEGLGKVATKLGAGKLLGGAAEKAVKGEKFFTDGKLNKAGEGQASKNLGAYATVILASIVAAKYWIEKPNEEQVRAARELYSADGEGSNLLLEGQNDLQRAQDDMETSSEEICDKTQQAEEANDDANDQIVENKSFIDIYKSQYKALSVKSSVACLTQAEKSNASAIKSRIKDMADGIGTVMNDTKETVDELHSDIEDHQSTFDDSAETIANVEGITDYAEGFDETTRTLCYVEGISQTLNAAGAGQAAAQLFSGGFWNWAFAAIGVAAAASSTIAAGKQFGYAGDVSAEIDVREQVQEFGTQTQEIYDEEIDNFAGNLEIVETLELEEPEDLGQNLPDIQTGIRNNDLIIPAAKSMPGNQSGASAISIISAAAENNKKKKSGGANNNANGNLLAPYINNNDGSRTTSAGRKDNSNKNVNSDGNKKKSKDVK